MSAAAALAVFTLTAGAPAPAPDSGTASTTEGAPAAAAPASDPGAAPGHAAAAGPAAAADTDNGSVPAPTAAGAASPSRLDVRDAKAKTGAGGAMLVLGIGAGISAAALAHSSLHPRCAIRNDVRTCEIPTGDDIRRRAGYLVGAGGLTVAGGVFGGLGARFFMRGLGDPNASLAERTRLRKAATAVGATTLTLGLATLITGPILIGVGVKQIGNSNTPRIDPTDIEATERSIMADLAVRVNGLRIVRSGFALSVISPTLIATGAGFLRNRPARNKTVRITPTLNPTFAGITVSGRF